MKKAIIFDLDGTALPIGLDEQFGLPSKRLKSAITSLLPAYHLSTATGRSLHYAQHIIDFLELSDPCIIASGTEIYDPKTMQILWREAIPAHTYEHIKAALKDNQDFVFSGDNHDAGAVGKTVQKLLTDNVAVIYVIAVDPEEAAAITEALQHPDLTIINMHSFEDGAKRDIHIHSVKASKEHAVAALLKILGVKGSDSTVVGDGLNDLHLFAAGGTKIAMGNAVPELKEVADKVISSIDQDGFAEYLESLI